MEKESLPLAAFFFLFKRPFFCLMLRVRTVHKVLDKDGGNTRPNTERRSAHGIFFFMTEQRKTTNERKKKNQDLENVLGIKLSMCDKFSC